MAQVAEQWAHQRGPVAESSLILESLKTSSFFFFGGGLFSNYVGVSHPNEECVASEVQEGP